MPDILRHAVITISTCVFFSVSGVAADETSETDIRVPEGFTTTVFAEGVGRIRHMVMSASGWLYGALSRPHKKKGAVALYDGDGDGVAEKRVYFADRIRGTGIGIYDGHLYYGTNVSIIRWKLPDEGGVPTAQPELVAHGFGRKRQNAEKSFTFDNKGGLYVNVGAPSNACSKEAGKAGSPGMDPCPILEEYGGIWKFDAKALMQHQVETASLYATGIRNAVALDWNPGADSLFLVQNGRNRLAEFFPQHYTLQAGARLPAEEFHKVPEGADIGWPYSYYDPLLEERIIMPEYGGDGLEKSEKGQKPIVSFPGHWAPSDLLFKRRGGMPAAYSNGAFVSFRGAWNEVPISEQGYSVVFLPMDTSGKPSGNWRVFADGFTGNGKVENPRQAKHRPAGLAEGPDGALYVSSGTSGGYIWRIAYDDTQVAEVVE